MPLINVSMFKGRTQAQKDAFMKKITQAAVEELNSNPEYIWIVLEEKEDTDWWIGYDSYDIVKQKRAKQKE